MLRVRSEKLNTERPLDFIEVQIFPRPFVPTKDPFRGNELGSEDIRAVFLAKLAENFVRHAGHWRKKERKRILKPGQRHISYAHFLTKLVMSHPLGIFLALSRERNEWR